MNPWHTRAVNLRDQLVAWRRDFHQHPELSWEETRTAGIVARHLSAAGIVARHLSALGYEVSTGVARTGVIGLLRGALAGPTIMFRFDMDALKVTEDSRVPYASLTPSSSPGGATSSGALSSSSSSRPRRAATAPRRWCRKACWKTRGPTR